MNKKLLSGIIISLLLLVVLFLAIYWPPFSSEEASGTIGKADKPASEAQDPKINLSSEMLRDTTVLKRTIQDLVQFYGFTFSLAEYIDTWLIPQLDKYYLASVAQEDIQSIKDFGSFLKNNNNTLRNTLETLGSLYGTQNTQAQPDLENNLLGFIGYVNQMIVKDSVFDVVLARLDKYIKQTENEKTAKKSQIKNLKDIRDKLLIDNYMIALALNQDDKLKTLSDVKIYNQENLKMVLNNEIKQFMSNIQLQSGEKIKSNTLNIEVGSNAINSGILLQSWWIQSYGSNKIDFNINLVNSIELSCKPCGLVPFSFVDVVDAQESLNLLNPLLNTLNNLKMHNLGELNSNLIKFVQNNESLKLAASSQQLNVGLTPLTLFSGGILQVKPIDP